MKKVFSLILITCGLILSTIQVAQANDGNPVDMLKSVADKMIDGLRVNKATLKTNPAFVYSLAYKIVVPHADLSEMSKRVLPPQTWNKATSSQRAKFEGEFTKLLVRTYASALSDYSNQQVEIYPVRGGYQGKSVISVSSQIIRSDGPAVAVNYRLISKSSGWKLFDMSVEGISLLESFRSQFADKLSQGNIDDLIRDLVQHNSRSGA